MSEQTNGKEPSDERNNSENCDNFNKLIISDIDQPLYIYDISNYLQNVKNGKMEKFKSNALIIFSLLNGIRTVMYPIIFKSRRIPLYYLEIAQYTGGIIQFSRWINAFGAILSIAIVFIFNYSQNFEWLQVIQVLKGSKIMDTFISFDEKVMKEFISKIKFVRTTLKIGIYSTISFISFVAFVIIFISEDLIDLFKYGILTILLYNTFAYIFLFITHYSFLYFYIICYYCRMRIKLFDQFIDRKTGHLFLKYSLFNKIIREHCGVCNQITVYNKFWRYYFFAVIYTLIPMNLMLLHQNLFEKLNFSVCIAFISVNIGCLAMLLMLNIKISSINKEMSKSYKCLNKYYTNTIYLMNTRHKIKVSKIQLFYMNISSEFIIILYFSY